MKKVYKLENLDCAVCAEKMKRAIEKIDGVEACEVSFLMQRLTITADEAKLPEILKKAEKACKKVEPDCKILY